MMPRWVCRWPRNCHPDGLPGPGRGSPATSAGSKWASVYNSSVGVCPPRGHSRPGANGCGGNPRVAGAIDLSGANSTDLVFVVPPALRWTVEVESPTI